jgi:hypothetical protein
MPVHGGRSVGNACVGALERSGPHPRGCLALERGGPRLRGGVEPSSEADPARGGVRASSEADLARGSVSIPRARRTSLEGHPLCCPGGLRGAPGSWLCCACVLGARVDSCFAFFAGFKRVSPGYLGDPYCCP